MTARSSVLAIVLVAAGLSCRAGSVTEPLTPRPSDSTTQTPGTEPSGDEPAIVVSAPLPGDEIVAPVTISGTADVYEATVSVVVLGADGGELASSFATATCGSGCRGTFSTELYFFVDEVQDGSVEVFESSAEDGSRLHLVSIPVVLVPGS